MSKLSPSRYLFTNANNIWLYENNSQGSHWCKLAAKQAGDRVSIAWSSPQAIVFAFTKWRQNKTVLRRYVFGKGWESEIRIDTNSIKASVGSMDPVVSYAPDLHRKAVFVPVKSSYTNWDIDIVELPNGKPKRLVQNIISDSSREVAAIAPPQLLWLDNSRIIYQASEPPADPNEGEELRGYRARKLNRLQQVLYVVDIRNGRKLMRLPVPGKLRVWPSLWRDEATGMVRYRTVQEYIVDVLQKKLVPVSQVDPFYVKLSPRKGEIWDRLANRCITSDSSHFYYQPPLYPWSHDGRYVAYWQLAPPHKNALWIYDHKTGQSTYAYTGLYTLVGWVN
jgi:hypothetical protein